MLKPVNLKAFKVFFKSPSAGGIILLACVVLSLIIANTGLAHGFDSLLQIKLGVETHAIHLKYTLISWINDGLMAIFFLLAGLEIKREIAGGELSSVRLAALPVFAAIGGVIAPALIYIFFNHNNAHTAHGWGIPMATDIGFALGVLSLLGNKVPSHLKVLLVALAIVDDLIAIIVIALFYSAHLHFIYLACSAGIFALLILFNRIGIKNLAFYLIPGMFMWYCIHHSGIHATIAGVVTALALPASSGGSLSPLEKLEHALSNPVNFIIMPIFAFANTNITFTGGMPAGLLSNMGLGILAGLFLGKPAGIFIMSWLSVKLKIAQLPANVSRAHILGLGMLGGIGFTMSVFIALLSFKAPGLQAQAKFAVLSASTLSGITGYFFLSFYNQKGKKANPYSG